MTYSTSFMDRNTFVKTTVYYEPIAPYTIVRTKRCDGREPTAKQLAKLQKEVHKGWGYKPPKEPKHAS